MALLQVIPFFRLDLSHLLLDIAILTLMASGILFFTFLFATALVLTLAANQKIQLDLQQIQWAGVATCVSTEPLIQEESVEAPTESANEEENKGRKDEDVVKGAETGESLFPEFGAIECEDLPDAPKKENSHEAQKADFIEGLGKVYCFLPLPILSGMC